MYNNNNCYTRIRVERHRARYPPPLLTGLFTVPLPDWVGGGGTTPDWGDDGPVFVCPDSACNYRVFSVPPKPTKGHCSTPTVAQQLWSCFLSTLQNPSSQKQYYYYSMMGFVTGHEFYLIILNGFIHLISFLVNHIDNFSRLFNLQISFL